MQFEQLYQVYSETSLHRSALGGIRAHCTGCENVQLSIVRDQGMAEVVITVIHGMCVRKLR